MKLLRNILLVVVALILLYFIIPQYSPLGPAATPWPSQSIAYIPADLLDSFREEVETRFPGRGAVEADAGLVSVRLSVSSEEFSDYYASFSNDGDVSAWYAFTDDVSSLLRDLRQRLTAAGISDAVIATTIYRPVNDSTSTVLARFVNSRCDYDYFDDLAGKSSAPALVSGTSLGEQNALRSAQSYLRSMSFSKTGLLDQLEYEGYSYDEARYAVNACGADWNEQAYKKAQSYLRSSSFSRDGLISQLEYEGFTHDEALYGVTKAGY